MGLLLSRVGKISLFPVYPSTGLPRNSKRAFPTGGGLGQSFSKEGRELTGCTKDGERMVS